MQSTLFLPHCPVGWALLRGIEKPQNWIVAGQEGDVLKPNRLNSASGEFWAFPGPLVNLHVL